MSKVFNDQRNRPRKSRRARCKGGMPKGLGGRQKGRLDGRGDVDRHEAIRGEQVVLAALVDDAKVSVALGVLVWKDDVDLVALERGLVLHHYRRRRSEKAASHHGLSRSSPGPALALRVSFLPMPCASYQCNSASRIRPLLSRIRATAFHLPPAALAIQAPQPRQLAECLSQLQSSRRRRGADKLESHRASFWRPQ